MVKKSTILIVDDLKLNIYVLDKILSESYETILAYNGTDALNLVNKNDIDLILLDIEMPGMDGYEVCTILKENNDTKNIPVIFITSHTDEQSIEKAYDVGCSDYITKPFKKTELKARVSTQLKINELTSTLNDKITTSLYRLHNAQKLAKIGSWEYNIKNNILIWDDESYNIFEVDKKEHPNLTIDNYLNLISFDSGPSFFEIYNNHLKNKESYLTTHKIKTKKGNVKYIEERCETIFDLKGNPIISKGIVQDVTEQKTIQIKLEQKEQQMLHQSRLAQMGEMISMIAHQWRQPLSAISARSNNLLLKIVLGKDLDRDLFKEEITYIDEYSQHLSKTIDDFRNFFKEDKVKEITTLENIIHQTLDIIQVSVENKNIKIVTNFRSNQPFEIYSNEVKQVVLNIIKNAEDVLLEKNILNPTISIETTTKDNNNILTIKDNAGGIKDDIIGKIFDPYFSTKLEKDGTGLGLYMSKIIIEEHCNGILTVNNDKDGAIFEIKLNI